jgi:hypothetical protein
MARSLSALGGSLAERTELSQRGAAVDPYVFPADQALAELKDMENTDADPAAAARYAQEVTNYLGSPDFVVNDKVVAIKPMEHIHPLALDVGKQITVPLADSTRPMQDAGRVADHIMDYVVSEGAQRALDVALGLFTKVPLKSSDPCPHGSAMTLTDACFLLIDLPSI